MKQLLMLCMCLSLVWAQNKEMTLEDAASYQYYARPMAGISWRPNTAQYSYAKDGTFSWYEAKNQKVAGRVTVEDLNKGLKTNLDELPALSWVDEMRLMFRAADGYYTYDVSSKKTRFLVAMPKGAAADFCKANGVYAYTKGHNLFILQGKTEINVSANQNPEIQYGQAAHRSEFGISKGTFWSPNGTYLAFYKMDECPVSNVPYMNVRATPVENKPFKYPMAGQATHLVTIGVYMLKSNATVYLQSPDPKDTYLTNITWSPDEKHIYVAELNRDQNHMKLVQYDAKTGARLKVLFEEKDPEYVEPEHGPMFLPESNTEFLWLSERSGYQHIYHYNTEGKLLNTVTAGQWKVTELLGISDGWVYYQSTAASPLQRQLYKTKLGGMPMLEAGLVVSQNQLSNGKGYHTATLSDKGAWLMTVFSNLDTPFETRLLDKRGRTIKTLHKADNPTSVFPKANIELGEQMADDGTLLYTRTVYPPNFDANKKYPVLLYVYNGPHVQLITNRWLGGVNMFLYYMAQQGYIVYTVDGRGSLNRGLNFEQATFRNLGELEMKDQITAITQLSKRKYVDANRIAVHGWSYGGYMTAGLVSRYPGKFGCGIAGAPVMDWKYYEIMYTERYMDTPQTNSKGYDNSSNLKYASQLADPLLVIHGTADDVVVWQHTLAYMDACIDSGTYPDYFVYPGDKHHVGYQRRQHLYTKMYNYLQLHNRP